MDATKYRDMAELLQTENRQQRITIEDLEMKNRLLVDKLNNQIYQQAAIYKEKTINALSRGRSDDGLSPMRDYGNNRAPNNSNVYGLGNESAFARSPLGNRGSVQPSYHVKQELEKIEKTIDRPQSHSPMRNRPNRSNSPSRVAAALQDSRGVGGASYINRSPLLADGRRKSGSPLREKSP